MKPLAFLILAALAVGQTTIIHDGKAYTTSNLGAMSEAHVLVLPEPLQEGDICRVHNGTCVKFISGGVDPEHTATSPELAEIKLEPMVVPVVKVVFKAWKDCHLCENWLCTPKTCGPDAIKDVEYDTCADKRRVMLTSESGEKMCVLFPQENP